MIGFAAKLLGTILGSDLYILLAGILAAASIYNVLRLASQVEEEVKMCKKDPNKRFAEDLAKRLNKWYNFFTTMITIFPLLGMLGTVKSLIELNLASEQIAELQSHFFDALTSTAWGIIFAIAFKVVNSAFEYQVICQIEAAQRILDEKAKSDDGISS